MISRLVCAPWWLWVAVAAGAMGLCSARGAATTQPDVYAKDVEFLLAELGAKAVRLLHLKGVDWPAVSNQFRAEVKAVTNDAGHLLLCQRLVARLRDGHAGLLDLKNPPPDEAAGRRMTGPRVHLLVNGERVYVRQAFGTAAQRGIAIGMEVTRIDDLPARAWLTRKMNQMLDQGGYSTDQQALYAACHWGLADWEGTRIQFELVQDARTNLVTILRQGGPNFAPNGPVFPPRTVKTLGRQTYGKTAEGFGYVHLRDIPGNLPEQLDIMLAALGEMPGLILDLRANGGGGCDHAAVFGRFIATGKNWRQYQSAGARPFAGPMVVIVDSGTRSAGETVAGMLKEDGRAWLIGDGPTAGMSSQKDQLTVPSKLFSVRFSVASNMSRLNGGRGIEGLGIAPHELVRYDPAELAKGVDTLIRRGEEMLKAGLPRDKVPYQPPLP
jgi:carboxyl-terminal processing protease